MHTLFLVHSSAPSGAELSLLRTAKAWPQDQLLSVVFGQSDGLVADYEKAGVSCTVLPIPGALGATRRASGVYQKLRGLASLLQYSARLRRLLREVAPDTVVGGSAKAVLYGRVATIGLPVAFVWECRDRVSPQYFGRLTGWIYSVLVPKVCDGIVVNSQSTADSVEAAGTPVLIAPPGFDSNLRFEPRRRAIEEVAVVGRLAPWKGQDVALRAFAEVFGGGNVRLSVVGGALFGEQDYERELHDLVHQLGLERQVTFYGHVNDPRDILCAADVLVHSSIMPEPFGSVIIEGMQAGCVVIATKPGGPAEIITDGSDGFLTPVGEVDSLAEVLHHVRDMQAAERQAVALAGQRNIQKYDIERIVSARVSWLIDITARKATKSVTRWDEADD